MHTILYHNLYASGGGRTRGGDLRGPRPGKRLTSEVKVTFEWLKSDLQVT